MNHYVRGTHPVFSVGGYALVAATIQSWCFEIVAYHASQSLRLRWFGALLRQDPAYFDVNDIGGMAAQIGPSANKFRRGMGRKFGEGVQFFTTGVGGLVYAFYASWQTALIMLCVIPFAALSALLVMSMNQKKTTNASKSYKRAGGVAYSAVSAIKTVLSLNAVPELIRQYKEATEEAFKSSVSVLPMTGFANGKICDAFGTSDNHGGALLTP